MKDRVCERRFAVCAAALQCEEFLLDRLPENRVTGDELIELSLLLVPAAHLQHGLFPQRTIGLRVVCHAHDLGEIVCLLGRNKLQCL